MLYNSQLYDGGSYDLTSFNVTYTESIASSDDLTKSVGIVKTDSQGTADALSDGASLAAFLETIRFDLRARTPFSYNNGRYNDYMYDTRLDEDEITLLTIKVLTDSFSESDSVSTIADYLRTLSESFSETDAVNFMANALMEESIFIDEIGRVEISNKALNETLRVADWLTIDRKPVNQEWGD